MPVRVESNVCMAGEKFDASSSVKISHNFHSPENM